MQQIRDLAEILPSREVNAGRDGAGRGDPGTVEAFGSTPGGSDPGDQTRPEWSAGELRPPPSPSPSSSGDEPGGPRFACTRLSFPSPRFLPSPDIFAISGSVHRIITPCILLRFVRIICRYVRLEMLFILFHCAMLV